MFLVTYTIDHGGEVGPRRVRQTFADERSRDLFLARLVTGRDSWIFSDITSAEVPSSVTEPVGPAGATVAEAHYWTVEPDTTPLALVAAVIGSAVQAQLDEPSDDQAAFLADMVGDAAGALFADAAGRVSDAVRDALAAWVQGWPR